MQSSGQEKDESSAGLFPIRTVSELTGVNSITLRAWESRYGLIEPIRKASGHRLYTQGHIDLINQVVGLLDRGMRIGQVKAEVLANNDAGSNPVDDTQNYWQRGISGMIAAIIRFDEQALERIYGDALAYYPVRTVTEKLLTPLLRELGERWMSDRGSVAEEHFFGFYLRNKLGARFHHRLHNQTGPKLLLACLPGEFHELGLLIFALDAADHGFQTVLLGANMPLEELQAAVKKTQCDALVLSGVIELSETLVKEKLPRLINQLKIPVFVGGGVAAAHYSAIKNAGAYPLGSDIDTGIKQISKRLNA